MTENYEVIENPPKKVLAKIAWGFAWRFFLVMGILVWVENILLNTLPISDEPLVNIGVFTSILWFPSLPFLWMILKNYGVLQIGFFDKNNDLKQGKIKNYFETYWGFFWRAVPFLILSVIIYLPLKGVVDLFDGAGCGLHSVDLNRPGYFCEVSLIQHSIVLLISMFALCGSFLFSFLRILGKTYGDKRLLIYRKKGDVI